MTLFLHELKQNKTALLIWSLVISFMLAVCILIYPEMASEMDEISDLFSNMGAFSHAFGMSQINFGDFSGYFGIECGNTLGLGSAFFAALLGISVLSKEERDRTAEFLLTHPIKRWEIVLSKLLASLSQILILNLIVFASCFISAFIIGEKLSSDHLLILLSFLILQIEIFSISFCISTFLKKGGMGIGIGITVLFYFLNLISNITPDIKILKYITPYAYTDSGSILTNHSLEVKYLLIGFAITILTTLLAFWKYTKKDIT